MLPIRTVLGFFGFLGAISLIVAVVWQCYLTLTLSLGYWRALVILTAFTLAFGIAWVVAVIEYPVTIEALDRDR